MNKDQSPVPPPKLLKAKSTVETCASCGAWAERYPTFLGEDDGFRECEKCGSTSFRIRDGRVYAPKSRDWDKVVEWFNDLYLDIPRSEWDTVETDPPMKDLDWKAIRAWERGKHIRTVEVGFGLVAEDDGDYRQNTRN